MHEARMTEFTTGSSFLTLTYSDDHLPENYSVSVREMQLFMKRLRFELQTKIRFFAVGEYGEQTLRPHYHALIFGYDFRLDRKFYKDSDAGGRLYKSEQLAKVWSFGEHLVGDVTYKSAAYCTRYAMKKICGDLAPVHYLRTHPKTNLVVQVEPEFAVRSMRPGLGAEWLKKYQSDVFPSDFLVVDGRQHVVPRYYLQKLTEEEQNKTKRIRKRKAVPTKWNRTNKRLQIRETIAKSRLSKLKRKL